MNTHRDDDFPGDDLEQLQKKAEKMLARGESSITAGRPEEEAIFSQQIGTIFVRRLPDDPLALRVSVGEGRLSESAYLVFRGDPRDCIELLERGLSAMKAAF